MKFSTRSLITVYPFAMLMLVAAGCGDAGPPKSTVKGKVTWKGEPVATGDIKFTPVEGGEGIPTAAPIVDGFYETDARFGIAAGTYDVSIIGYESHPTPAPGEATDPNYQPSGIPDPQGILNRDYYIPEKYNVNSELEPITVTGTEGVIEKNYDLTE